MVNLANETNAGIIIPFLCLNYLLALVGGLIADKTRNYKGVILVGLVLMALGYLVIAIPTPTPVPSHQFALFLGLTCFGLLIIAFGNGLFKGNLQALVGQMYDNPQYGKMRDSGFQLFYMFINVGAIFAPLTAIWVRNWWVEKNGFFYDADLPALAHQYLGNTITPEGTQRFQQLAAEVGFTGTDLTAFSNEYLNVFLRIPLRVCCGHLAMLISLVIYMTNRKDSRSGSQGSRWQRTRGQRGDGRERGETTLVCTIRGIRCGYILLVLVPPKRVDVDFLREDYTDLSQLKINLGFRRCKEPRYSKPLTPIRGVPHTHYRGILRLVKSKRKRALYSPEDSYRDGYCRDRVRGDGRGVDRAAQQSRGGRDGRTSGRGKGYTVVAYRNVLHPYRGRAVYQPTGNFIRVEGGAT